MNGDNESNTNKNIITTDQKQLKQQKMSMNNIKDDVSCPSTFVYDRILKCNELRLQFTFGKCEMNKCHQCFPPNLDERRNNIVKKFMDSYTETMETRYKAMNTTINKNNIYPGNKTPLIVMVMNKGYLVFFYNWLCSLEYNKIKHIKENTLLIVTDKYAKEVAIKTGFKMIYEPEWFINSFNIGIKKYSSVIANQNYNYLVALQISVIADLVLMGYNVLFQDIDIVYIKNPVPYIMELNYKYNDVFDIIAMHDHRWDIKGPINSGFMYVNSNCKTKSLMKHLIGYISITILHGSDQLLWNQLIKSVPFRDINVHFLHKHKFICCRELSMITTNGESFNFKNNKERETFLSNQGTFMIHAAWTTNADEKIQKFGKMSTWYIDNKCPIYSNQIEFYLNNK